MTRFPTCRILHETEPHSGAWNMAVDEALLESAAESGLCTVRVYRWSEPTLSLGYFQSADSVRADPTLGSLPAVRRLSGGGAILHHHELTYSCVVPSAQRVVSTPPELYALVHGAIVEILRRRGFPVQFRGDIENSASEPFLCFGRGDRNDLLLHGQKILGSAQRRRRGTILQHGSLILRRSAFAPQFAGLCDLHPSGNVDELSDELHYALASLFGEQILTSDLSADELTLARHLASRSYGEPTEADSER